MSTYPLLNLEEVLATLFQIFEAAVYTLRTHLVATMEYHPREALYMISYHGDAPKHANNVFRLPPGRGHLAHALAKKDLCDAFCALMASVIRPILREVFNASVRTIDFFPRPVFRIIKHERELPLCPHSVLEITTRAGQVLLMDGTPEQFGWRAPETWLRTKTAVEYCDMDTHRGFSYPSAQELEKTLEGVMAMDGGYWRGVAEKIQELEEEIDWGVLVRMSRDERHQRVFAMAEAKFQDIAQD